MIPMWTMALIVLVGVLAVGLDVTLLIEKFKGNLDGSASEAEGLRDVNRVAEAVS